MSDVRSLLRSELASRADQSSTQFSSGKKRKAAAAEDVHTVPSKKTRSNSPIVQAKPSEPTLSAPRRAAGAASSPELYTVVEEELDDTQADPRAETQIEPASVPAHVVLTPAEGVELDEWEAFQRDIAMSVPEPTSKSALSAPASIEAPPLLAAEATAEEAGGRTKKRDHFELESKDERDDAAIRLQDEFEEMEVLEERAGRLRARREALRRSVIDNQSVEPLSDHRAQTPNKLINTTESAQDPSEDEEQDVTEDDEDWLWNR